MSLGRGLRDVAGPVGALDDPLPTVLFSGGNASASSNSTYVLRVRQGIVFDKWPFRLDVPTEYQDWVLVAMSIFLVFVWCSPCYCGRMKNSCSRAFTAWVYTRLHTFFCIVTYFNLVVLMFTIGLLPDWTVNQYLESLAQFVSWVLIHLQKMITSLGILIGFYLMIKFRDRIAMAAGMEHVTVFRLDWRELLWLQSKKRPVEIFIWKVEDLQSSAGKVLKANDVYVECHYGYNEPMRTRVHNNAGSSCVVGESFQMNLDETATASVMTLFIKDQALLLSSELAKLMLSTRELCGIEDQTGKRRTEFTYSEENFVSLNLMPRGKIWLAISPVEEVDEESRPLMHEDDLVTC